MPDRRLHRLHTNLENQEIVDLLEKPEPTQTLNDNTCQDTGQSYVSLNKNRYQKKLWKARCSSPYITTGPIRE